ncbi:MAG: hypothetical protein QM576_02305 [Rhodopseudomonas sp.]|uniref:DUF7662 domain-containing protein n=1 Tax=Rhodopseudomonas sp. TaxID=1078 RepID=UPI0039E5F76E
MSKYEPLPRFLGSVGRSAHRMSFSEIERILGFKLPNSAYQHEAWWSNNATGHSHARAWLQSGWRTEAIDLAARKVTFQRRGDITEESARPSSGGDPWGCMAGTITIMPDFDVTMPTGDHWNAEQGRLLSE